MKKRVLITGAKGFVGSHLVNQLQSDYEVISFVRDKNGDLCSCKSFPSADIILHIAGKIPHHGNKPYDVIKNNVLSTINLCDNYMEHETKPLIMYCSSAETQVSATEQFNYKIPTDEQCPFVMNNYEKMSYGASKSIGEQIIVNSGLPYIIFKLHNVYGPGQYGQFIGDYIDRASNGDYKLYGHNNTRSWLYISDLVDALKLLMATKNAVNEVFNIGHSSEVSVLEVARTIHDALGIKADPIIDKNDTNVTRRCPNIDKIYNFTGWKPKINLEEGIAKTVKAYLENR